MPDEKENTLKKEKSGKLWEKLGKPKKILLFLTDSLNMHCRNIGIGLFQNSQSILLSLNILNLKFCFIIIYG